MIVKIHTRIGAVWLHEEDLREHCPDIADKLMAHQWSMGLANLAKIMRADAEVHGTNPEFDGTPETLDPDSYEAFHRECHGGPSDWGDDVWGNAQPCG